MLTPLLAEKTAADREYCTHPKYETTGVEVVRSHPAK
jgi:hypothetical protein